MILKPKPLDQMTDDELDKKLRNTAAQEEAFDKFRYAPRAPHAGIMACAILGVACGIAKLAFMSANPFIMMGGIVAAAGELVVGMFVCAYGFDRMEMKLRNMWKTKADNVKKEKVKRVLERTPSFQQQVRETAAAAAKALKDAFNYAVDKTFHGGTEKPVVVKKPLQLKKPDAPKKKSIFTFGR